VRLPGSAMGLGAPPVAYAGTYSDPNCPTWCFFAGNVVDEAISNSCWPCHNICPDGTQWDKSSSSCLPVGGGTPATTSCPGYCNWLPLANTLLTECQPCKGTSGGSGLTTSGLVGLAIGGLLVVTVLIMAVKR